MFLDQVSMASSMGLAGIFSVQRAAEFVEDGANRASLARVARVTSRFQLSQRKQGLLGLLALPGMFWTGAQAANHLWEGKSEDRFNDWMTVGSLMLSAGSVLLFQGGVKSAHLRMLVAGLGFASDAIDLGHVCMTGGSKTEILTRAWFTVAFNLDRGGRAMFTKDRRVVAIGAGAKKPQRSSSPRKIKVCVVQMAVDDGPKEARLERMQRLLDDTRGSDLVVLPELWGVGYFAFDRYRFDSERMGGVTVEAMRQKAAELGATLMMGSFVESRGASLYNTSVLLNSNGDFLGTYRKMHLFGFQSDENRLLTPGRRVGVIQSDLATIGLSTCFDLRFPELYRRQLESGVEMFLVASAWPHPRLEHWRILTRARAIENQSFLVAANCVGVNRGKTLCGHSVIVDPFGKVIAEAGEDEIILRAEIDIHEVAEIRRSFPSVSCRVLT